MAYLFILLFRLKNLYNNILNYSYFGAACGLALLVPRRTINLILVDQGPTVLAVGAGGNCLPNISLFLIQTSYLSVERLTNKTKKTTNYMCSIFDFPTCSLIGVFLH